MKLTQLTRIDHYVSWMKRLRRDHRAAFTARCEAYARYRNEEMGCEECGAEEAGVWSE